VRGSDRKWEGRRQRRKVEEMRGEGRGGGPPRAGLHPHGGNPEKYLDCRTDLIGRGGNIDVCPGRQIPSCSTAFISM